MYDLSDRIEQSSFPTSLPWPWFLRHVDISSDIQK
jgi:hypothetical protein